MKEMKKEVVKTDTGNFSKKVAGISKIPIYIQDLNQSGIIKLEKETYIKLFQNISKKIIFHNKHSINKMVENKMTDI